jgi:hypothetical protein
MDFVMHIKRVAFLVGVFFTFTVNAQDFSFAKKLYENHLQYKAEGLDTRRIKHDEVLKNIKRVKEGNPSFYQVNPIGKSVEGRSIQMISFGQGPTQVLLWSQMHGNESTATRALFDLFNYFSANRSSNEVQLVLSALSIHVIPMLNPDGAESFQRENALGIDLNRDAVRLVSPEAQLLKRIRDSLNADYGFNLHDQSRYYNVSKTPKQASISFLATAYNYEKEMNEKRRDAAQLIGYLRHINELFIPGHTGRYSDEFEPRAFGDNIQLWGTRLILLETGGFAGDREKNAGRLMNYVLVGSALESIATNSFENISEEVYWSIPENDRNLVDLKIEKISVKYNGTVYVLDIGIHLNEINSTNGYSLKAAVTDRGDLSTYYGYQTLDASGYTLVVPKVYNKKIRSEKHYMELLSDGYAFTFKSRRGQSYAFPLIDNQELSMETAINMGTFLLESDGVISKAIINGSVIEILDNQ